MSHIDPELHRIGMKYKFIYSIVGLFMGGACILAGVILGLSGAVGHTSWTASALGFKTEMSDAAPGVIVFVVGIFFVLITRFKVNAYVNSEIPNAPSRAPEKGWFTPLESTDKPEITTTEPGPHFPNWSQPNAGSTGSTRISEGLSYKRHE